jgi:Flp pilus assembly protein TadG
MNGYPASGRPRRAGSSSIEFTLIALTLIMLVFTIIEIDRIMLVTGAIADSTRAGMRYAIVHGADDLATTDDIKTVIGNFAQTGILDPAQLAITITYSACSTDPGDGCSVSPYTSPGAVVDIKTTYPYNPFTAYFPLSVNIGSTSEGIIVF